MGSRTHPLQKSTKQDNNVHKTHWTNHYENSHIQPVSGAEKKTPVRYVTGGSVEHTDLVL